MSKTLLILGASYDQEYAYITAINKGIRTIAIDQNPKSPCFKIADDYAVVSTRDIPSLKKFLDSYTKKGKIDGVMTMGSDIPYVISEIAEIIGNPWLSRETAFLGSNKLAMKEKWKKDGIPIPSFTIVKSANEVRKFARKVGYPVIIKPVDRSGARGVFLLEKHHKFEKYFSISKQMSFSKTVMAEEYLSGPQISTESIIYNNFSITPGFVDRNYNMNERYLPQIMENSGDTPSILSKEDQKRVCALVERAARSLGVKKGVAKGDVVLTKNGPKMIEMAVRLSGGNFSDGFIPISIGVNIVSTIIDIAVGNKPNLKELQPKHEPIGVSVRYFFPYPGKLVKIRGLNEAKKYSWLKKMKFSYKVGDTIKKPASHADRFGFFITVGNSREEALKRAELIYQTVIPITI